jgi:hypothetical protein
MIYCIKLSRLRSFMMKTWIGSKARGIVQGGRNIIVDVLMILRESLNVRILNVKNSMGRKGL